MYMRVCVCPGRSLSMCAFAHVEADECRSVRAHCPQGAPAMLGFALSTGRLLVAAGS